MPGLGWESVATSWLGDLENRVVQEGSGVIPTLEVRVLWDMKLVGCHGLSGFLTLASLHLSRPQRTPQAVVSRATVSTLVLPAGEDLEE